MFIINININKVYYILVHYIFFLKRGGGGFLSEWLGGVKGQGAWLQQEKGKNKQKHGSQKSVTETES
jgi:hypothetical protein